MQTVPANNLFHKYFTLFPGVHGTPLPGKFEIRSIRQKGKNESQNKKYAKNDYFFIQWVILTGHFGSFSNLHG